MTGILGIDSSWVLFTGACSDSSGLLLLWCTYQIVRYVRRENISILRTAREDSHLHDATGTCVLELKRLNLQRYGPYMLEG